MTDEPTVGGQMVPPAEPITQFQFVQESGLMFVLYDDGSLWWTHFPEGVSSLPTWNKFWPRP